MSAYAAAICLALTVYHEARGEPLAAQHAVAEVVINRVVSDRFPSTVCEVVLQNAQFSYFTETGNLPETLDQAAYDRAWDIAKFHLEAWPNLRARDSFSGDGDGINVPDHYARYDIDNYWTRTMLVSTRAGSHIFYISEALESALIN